jgi:hypothetical protein
LQVAARTDVKSEIREAQRAWVREVARKMGLSVSDLAVKAGFADVTLTRFLNSKDYRGLLSALTIERIKRFANVPGPDEVSLEEIPGVVLGEGAKTDAASLRSARPSVAAMIEAALKGRANAQAWQLASSTLESLGYFRGDILISDASAHARVGDLVVAQVTESGSQPEFVFRILEPPYLIGTARDQDRRVLPIDNKRVIVIGPITESIRARPQ